ncbi:hypothetical protein DUI87_25094 [Hirundo rustica rustica]|uniref:Amidase domain-containing protein n=1 Tax=Hirundo rustica rustica TaxID=333673 RepID=A0A3M0JAQ9_HIRRU|nr:hypothetical protein DUI87_25094 [Hirundo rustica rustica]
MPMGKEEKANKADILLGVCYRPPSQEEEVDNLFYKQLENVSGSSALVPVGDFNLPDICWELKTAEKRQSRKFLEGMEDNFLPQLVGWLEAKRDTETAVEMPQMQPTKTPQNGRTREAACGAGDATPGTWEQQHNAVASGTPSGAPTRSKKYHIARSWKRSRQPHRWSPPGTTYARAMRKVVSTWGRRMLHTATSADSELTTFQKQKTVNSKTIYPSPYLNPETQTFGRHQWQKDVTCIEVVEAYVERIKEVNPLINAVVKDRFEEALQEARQVDKLLSEGPGDDCLEEKFPLLGVPITVKEAFSLYGMPNTSGLVNRRNVIATSDATVVSRLKQAGAIPLGVTNCSELCMWYESSNRVYGRTNNPYDLQRIVGGSSGGEGSVLAAACSVIGVGSDIGGSIRMPAFFNGVFGHKPTTGVVPNDGQFPDAHGVRTSYLCTGPMCRYAEDLEPVLRVMAGPGVSKLKLNEKVSLEKIKFHCMDHDGGSIFVSPVDKEILQAQKKVVEHLESDLGVRVQRVAIHKMKYSFQIWSAMMSSQDSKGQVCQTLGLTEKLVNLNLSGKAKLVSMGKSLQEEMEALLGSDGVLLYPSHPTIAPKHHSPICMPFNFAYTAIFNVLGLPVTQCPLGLGSEGLPLGIQLVAAAYNDHLTLAVARYLEKAFGGWVLPGKV